MPGDRRESIDPTNDRTVCFPGTGNHLPFSICNHLIQNIRSHYSPVFSSKGNIARVFNTLRKTLWNGQFPLPMEYSMSPARRHNQSPITKTLSSLASDLGIVLVVALVMVAVYLVDTMTPLGEPVWLLYLIPLILSYWSERMYAIPTVCIVTLLFLVGGFLVSPRGIPVSQAIIYRFTFFIIFIAASLVLWVIRRRQITEENLT
jgi:hypothetical protein